MEAEPRENPRTRRVRRLILDTAIEVLLECGASEVTAVVVAERADVARTTIYRHWPDPQSLLLATVAAMISPHDTTSPTGPLADDVRSELDHLRKRLIFRQVRSVFGALASHADQHPDFQDAQRLFITGLTERTLNALEAAQLRGELGADRDCEFEARLLVGPVLHQYLVACDDISDQLIDEVATRWLATI